MAELIGTVARVFTNRGTWCAGVLKLAEGSSFAGEPTCKFAGDCCVAPGDEVVLRGEWINDPKWGRQFKVSSGQFFGPEEQELDDEELGRRALVSFLKSNRDFKHVGPRRAEQLVDKFGTVEDLGDALVMRPETVVNAVPGLTRDRVDQLASMWAVSYLALKYEVELVKFGLSSKQARRVVAEFGKRTLEVLEGNPWLFYLEVPELGWGQVDKAGLKKGFDPDHRYRTHARSVWACREAAKNGHTWISGEEGLLLGLRATDEGLPKRYLDIVDRGEDAAPRYVQALHYLSRAEERIGRFLCDTAFEPPSTAFAELSDDARLTQEQRKAYEAARAHKVFILTGGAGTGKTYTASAIVEACEAAGGRAILAAPTGKAAKRLSESTGRLALTIHRLLLNPDDLGDLGRADLVLIDEVSMVDSHLLGWLIEHLNKKTSVILMGDPNQLPPVQAGNPLRDALGLDTPVVELAHVHRYAGDLKECCVRLLDGELSDTVPEAWEVYYTGGGQSSLQRLKEVLDGLEDEGISYPEDVQVLSPMKKGTVGTIALNGFLRARHHDDDELPEQFVDEDRIIHVKNNYGLEVFNGETGRVVSAIDERHLVAEIDNRLVRYEPWVHAKTGTTENPIEELQLAYALTVHKSQGSEYPVVIVMLDNYHTRMLHRNLLYTAVTRAKERVVLITTRSAAATAAKAVVRDFRRTLLS